MGDKALSQTLQTLVDLIEKSRELRDQQLRTPEELRRLDVMIDWTLEALREGVTSQIVRGIAQNRGVLL